MALVRWTPFREMLDMPREMRSFFGPTMSLMEPFSFPMEAFAPPMDVFTRGGDMVLRMELPGIDPKDLDISLSEHMLHIGGERRQDKEIKENDYYRRERSYGHFERIIPVPEKVTDEDVDATYKDGVLEVAVKGAVEEVPSKHIEVKTGAGEPSHITPKGEGRPAGEVPPAGEGPPKP